MTKRTLFLLILGLAALPRFWNLPSQGFFMFDEARYLVEADELSRNFTWAFAKWTGQDPAPLAYRSFEVGMARPLHIALLSALRCDVTAALIFMACCGIACVWLTGRLADACGGGTEVFSGFAMILVTLSPSAIFLSRTLLAEIDAVALVLAGIVVFLRARSRRAIFAAGLLYGLALIVQSRVSFLLPWLFLWAIVKRRSVVDVIILGAGTLAPVIGVELLYQAMKHAIVSSDASWAPKIKTYLEQFLDRSTIDRGRIAFNRPLFWWHYLANVEGPAILLLSVGGIGVAWRNRNRDALMLVGLALWTLITASFYDQVTRPGFRYGRMLAPAVPLLAVLAGMAIAALWARPRWGKIAAVAALAVCVIPRSPLILETAHMHADYGPVLHEAMTRTGSRTCFSEEPFHVVVHLGADRYPIRFTPRSDTMTVVIFDDVYARNFGFRSILPETPAFEIGRESFRPSRLLDLETMLSLSSFDAKPRAYGPARIFVMGPVEKSEWPDTATVPFF